MRRKYCSFVLIIFCLATSLQIWASAYDNKPKIVVVIVVDQLRGDLLERYHSEFNAGGFRLFMDHGAWFTNCYYNYANTRTAPGHATLGTGTYTLGHGIIGNDWWNPVKRRSVSSVEDDTVANLGASVPGASASPRNLLTDTFGDELKLATAGKSRVFGIALKDRAAILPAGFAADGAFWIDHQSGAWMTSTYYMKEAPAWLTAFNASNAAAKYQNREWKDSSGKVLESTAPRNDARGVPLGFYDRVGATPFANDYTIDFAKTVIENNKLGEGPSTDLMTISFSSNDIQGHRSGPDSPQEHAMLLALDRQLAGFFSYLTAKFGAANIVLALSADHGIAPLPAYSKELRFTSANRNSTADISTLNAAISKRLGHEHAYVQRFDYPNVYLDEEAFAGSNLGEEEAEQLVGAEMMKLGSLRGFATRSELAQGKVANTVFAAKYLNSYSPLPGWYILGLSQPFVVGYPTGTDHALPYAYDSHVPLAFYGEPFKTGYFAETVEPVDMAVTLSAILGINKPASAVGHVLSNALVRDSHSEAPHKSATIGNSKATGSKR